MDKTENEFTERVAQAIEDAQRKIKQNPTPELKRLQDKIAYLQSIEDVFNYKSIKVL